MTSCLVEGRDAQHHIATVAEEKPFLEAPHSALIAIILPDVVLESWPLVHRLHMPHALPGQGGWFLMGLRRPAGRQYLGGHSGETQGATSPPATSRAATPPRARAPPRTASPAPAGSSAPRRAGASAPVGAACRPGRWRGGAAEAC